MHLRSATEQNKKLCHICSNMPKLMETNTSSDMSMTLSEQPSTHSCEQSLDNTDECSVLSEQKHNNARMDNSLMEQSFDAAPLEAVECIPDIISLTEQRLESTDESIAFVNENHENADMLIPLVENSTDDISMDNLQEQQSFEDMNVNAPLEEQNHEQFSEYIHLHQHYNVILSSNFKLSIILHNYIK